MTSNLAGMTGLSAAEDKRNTSQKIYNSWKCAIMSVQLCDNNCMLTHFKCDCYVIKPAKIFLLRQKLTPSFSQNLTHTYFSYASLGLTFSEWQAGVCFRCIVEQNEGLRRWSSWKIDHLHAALQEQVMSEVHEMLLLYPYTCLRRHLFEEDWYSGWEERQILILLDTFLKFQEQVSS